MYGKVWENEFFLKVVFFRYLMLFYRDVLNIILFFFNSFEVLLYELFIRVVL